MSNVTYLNRIAIYTRQKTNRLISYLTLFLSSLLITSIFSASLFAQVAPVNPPTGGFAIDGGLRAGTPTSPSPFAAGQGDWFPAISPGTGGSVFTVTSGVIAAVDPSRSGQATDAFNSDDGVFTTGSKFNDYISSLSWFTNSAPDKNDINNAMYHVSRNPTNNDQWVFVSGDRLSTNGTSYIDFELLQGGVSKNGATSGGFTGTPLFPNDPNKSGGGRTLNDMIISMEYTNGGSKPNVYIYQWKKSGSTWSYQQVPVDATLLANAFAETNRSGAETDVPYPVFGPTNFTYKQYAFVEAAVNVSYLLQMTGAACSGLNIQTLWVKTKASASSTAALKDFMDPIPVNFTFGSTQITQIGPFCASNTTPQQLSANISGTFSGPGVTNNQFTPSVAGFGTHTINFASTDGSCTSSTTVTVVALPTVYTLSGNSICASAAGTGTVTLSNSQSGVSYQLKKASDNSSVQAAQSGTGAALTWINLPAGVSYYVTATGATPTSCTSNTGNASVTEVANPIAYTLSGNSICTSAPNTGVITLSNSQTGISYQLKKVSDNTSVQAAKSGTTGSALTWTGLPAGVSYKVVATGAAPTSCTSTTDPASVTDAPNPTVYILSGNSICATAPNTGVITLSNSQTGVSYQLKKTSDNSTVQSAQNGTTGAALTWINLPAGVSYYVTATGATPTSCTSNTGNASVTEVANPIAYTLSGNSICTSAPNTGVITLSNSQTGISYQLKKVSDNTSVQAAKSGTTGSALTWTGLPAGVSYKVVATGAAPTSCTSTTGNASITETANPDAPNVSIVNPTCSISTGTVTAASLGSDYEYSYNGAAYQPSPGPFTFKAGAGYSIIVRNKNTQCVSNPASCEAEPTTPIASTNQQTVTAQQIELTPQPTVKAAPNPYNDKVRFSVKSAVSGQGTLDLYNLLGQKVKTVFQGHVEAGQVQNFEYAVPNAQRSNLIYIFRVGDQRVSGKLLH